MKNLTTITTFALLLSSCTSSRVTGSWVNSNPTSKTYNTIMIAALTNNTINRSVLENEMCMALNKYGVVTYKSIDEFAPTLLKDSIDKKMLSYKVREKNLGAILTITILKKETDSRYHPGRYAYYPSVAFGYYDHLWGYYNYWRPCLYAPDYYLMNEIYFTEINLYDSQTEELQWSAQSGTYSSSELKTFFIKFSKEVADKLKKDKLISHSFPVSSNFTITD